MLPLSWRLEADSKSNSSSLLPFVTTMRVSSGWVASTSILLVAIYVSVPSRADAHRQVNLPSAHGAVRGISLGGDRGSASGAAGMDQTPCGQERHPSLRLDECAFRTS
jgi:hypothetical protein